ncbi:hypothetical protein BGX28_004817 [Mortierella sp. GBA30]|nr:hypothetical protein BGX28_004817 [Mortierella sp. GBA30]
MFAAKAPTSNVAGKQNGHTSQKALELLSNTGRESGQNALGSVLSRDKSFTSSASFDSESSWTPIQQDIPSRDQTRHLPELIGSGAIDEDSIYSKNERTMVAYLGPLPRDVTDALAETDFYTQPMIAKIDLEAGLGMVISQKTCYIWGVHKNTTYRAPPVCYTLPMPPCSYTSVEISVLLPVVTITKSEDRTVGVLACSPDGLCWYWDNIDLSVSNIHQHVYTKINVVRGDYITHVECAGPSGCYFGTRYANVYQVSTKKHLGTTTLSSAQLPGKGAGAVASIFSMIGMTPGPDTTQKITSLTSGPRPQDLHGRWDLFVMTRRSLFKWHIQQSGECILDCEFPLKEVITERIHRDFSATMPFGNDPRVRLLDIQYIKNGKLLVLATFFDTAFRTAATPLACGLFTLSSQYGSAFELENAKYIQRTIEEDLRPEASPKLVVPQGGPCVFIVMPRAVIITSTLPDFEFEDLVPLKTDRIIGFGLEDWKQRGQEIGGASELPIVCRTSGRLGIHIQLDGNGYLSSSSTKTGKELLTAQLQAKLEQAVFFSGKKNNPISFDLSHYDGGDLNEASLNVSHEILNSHSGLLSSGGDFTSRLSERYARIRSIIECIQEADMASRLSVDTRFQLCWGAEKLAAANALWNQYELRMASKDYAKASKSNIKQVMQEAAAQALQKIGAHTKEDPIAFFMTYNVNALAELLCNLHISAAKVRTVPAGQQAQLTKDINKIIVLSLRSAWSYRRQSVENYSLESSSSVESWTATEGVIKALTAHYLRTLAHCHENLELSQSIMDTDGHGLDQLTGLTLELKDQLCDLADVTLQAHSERLLYLEGLPQSSDHNVRISAAVSIYDEAKSQLLTPLIELKKIQPAMQLAQRYKDFTTLVKLCIDQENLMTTYLERYQQEFANALFQWYIDNDQLPTLMEQGEKYSDLFTVFLDSHDYSEVAWLHDIKINRFIEGSERIQDGAFLETNIDRRRTMFSLSKLLLVAGLPGEKNLDEESSMKYASRTNDEMEMATLQANIVDAWTRDLAGSMVSIRDRASVVVQTFKTPLLPSQPMLREAITKSVESLLHRQMISSEDVLDVLMLQQQREIDGFDVIDVALGICLHADDIPESRRPYVLQDIWRRVYIADTVEDADWNLEDASDLETRERLMQTWMCRAYANIYRAQGRKDELLLQPEQAKSNMPEELFKQRFLNPGEKSSNNEVEKKYKFMIKDYECENTELERRIKEGQLNQKWERVKQIVKEQGTGMVPASVLATEDALMDDIEMQEDMA